MGTAARTRELTPECYLTDDQATLLYVLDLPEPGEAVVEDVGSGEILYMQVRGARRLAAGDPQGGRRCRVTD